MEPSTPPPKKRRRRWLIVTVVLVLVLMVSWWNLSRGNARLVGRWQCGDQIIEFRDDGLVDSFAQFDGVRLLFAVRGLARFKAVGSRLRVMPDQAIGWQAAFNDIKLLLWRRARDELFYDGEIVSFTPAVVTLRGLSGPGSKPTTYTIQRIPE
ncbi:hypothetical protein Pan44_31340 [Caulifigura coniformis]|uniref:Uncharacterized protein n=1 Tax=Caulifigura coniformis TaxID=2527983 RepID=A0A517SG36_9PLAN|nr:hypothetical protein [Caulifigura coniformis]QDT55093.1 hypothetical protein Pan44_31340 [Caulifigura coniformis]